jgi:hypothetical protein
MELTFAGEVIYWRGPAPHHFVPVPDQQSAAIEASAGLVSYGWGCIPVTATTGDTTWTTSLFPKDGRYLVPLKAAVRKTAGLELGDSIRLTLFVDV